MEHIGTRGILHLYEIPEEFAQDEELFRNWWLPETRWDDSLGWIIVRPARISDEAKRQKLACKPVENMMTTAGIALDLANRSAATQGAMWPFSQIISVGNGSFAGATRGTTGVAGDGFTAGARKAPTTNQTVGFQSTVIFNFGSGDGVGTWTNLGMYGYKVSGSQNATTTTGTGDLLTIAAYPFPKGAASYSLNYVYLLSN